MAKQKVTVVIAGDNQLSGALGKATGDLSRFGSKAGGLGGIMKGIGVAVVAQQLLSFGKAAIDAADNVNKMSQRTGIATETLSGLLHAAKLADVESGDLETGLRKLNKSISDAAAGSKAAQDSFRALGVAFKDASGNALPADEVLAQVADRFQRMPDGANKAALAVELFGRSGTQLIPMLNNGRAGLEAMKKEAERLGISLSKDAAQAAEDFNDNVTRMQASAQGAAMQFMNGLLPALNQVFSAMSGEGVSANGALKAAGEALGGTVKMLALGFESLGIGVAWVLSKIGTLAEGIAALLTGDLDIFITRMKEFVGVVRDAQAEELAAALGKFQEKLDGKTAPAAKGGGGPEDVDRKKAEDSAKRLEEAKLKNRIESLKLAAEFDKAMNDQALARLEELHKAQLVSTADYLQQKQALQADSLNAEIYSLRQQIELADEVNKKSNAEGKIESLGQINKLTQELTIKQRELNRLQGLTAGGENDPQVAAARRREEMMRRAVALQREQQAIFIELDNRQREIARAVQTRQITEAEAEQRLNQVRAEAAEKLKAIAAAYREIAEASGDPQLKENSEQMHQDVKDLLVTTNRLRDAAISSIEDGLGSALTDFATGAKTAKEAFADFGRSVIADITRMIMKMIAMSIIQRTLGMIPGFGGFFGNLFGGLTKRAMGGPVAAGQPTLVGEAGMELFVPRTAGHVVPNHQVGGRGGVTVIQNFDNRGAGPREVENLRRAADQIKREAAAMALMTITEVNRRG